MPIIIKDPNLNSPLQATPRGTMPMNLTTIGTRNYKDVLRNGLTVVTIEMPHIHTFDMAMFVRAGLRLENEENNGISHFLEHMLFRGNKRFASSFLLNKEFEAIGRDFRASTVSEYSYYGFSPHISQVDRAVELFAEFFSSPTFPEIDVEREIIREEYLEDLNEDGAIVDIDTLACQLLYKGSTLGMPTIGTEETIGKIDKEMLHEYFDTYYVPQNMILVGAGPVNHEEFLDLVERHFAEFPVGGKFVSKNYFQGSIIEDQKKPEILFQDDSDSQAQLQICFRAVSYNHPDYFALNLANRVFDDGFTSRIQVAVREDRGLAYSVESRVTSWSDVGTIDFDVTVRLEKLFEVMQILLAEVKKFREFGPTEEELDHVKRRYFYELDADLDDPYRQIVRHGFPLLYSKDISVEEEWELVERITVPQVLEAARKIFVPEKLNVVIVGPCTPKIKKDIEELVESF